MPNSFYYGYRIVGPCTGERRRVDWQLAFTAYAACDQRSRVDTEAYLSAFTYGGAFRDHLASTGSTRGYSGPCGSSWLWFDLDRDHIKAALMDARRLCVQLIDHFGVSEEVLLAFFSGCKGFHIGLPLAGFAPTPGPLFHRITRRIAEDIANMAGVAIDTGVYDKVRAFRAPNSRHPKTGWHKHRFTIDELLHLNAERIIELSATPEPFDLPDIQEGEHRSSRLAADWAEADEQVQKEDKTQAERRAAIANGDTPAKLNRQTLDFIRYGVAKGDRHRLLFSAAANLSEFDCPPDLAHALLTEAALDTGLPPSDVYRQISCGLGSNLQLLNEVQGEFPNTDVASVKGGPTQTEGSNV